MRYVIAILSGIVLLAGTGGRPGARAHAVGRP